MQIPEQFKPLTAYIRRAEELDRDVSNPNSTVVAYHCRLYAINKGMKLNPSKESQDFLLSLMDAAELSKKNNPSVSVNGKEICENYAIGVFSNSDDEDRSAGSTMATAKGFYAAAAFFDILEQFGELEPYVSEYCCFFSFN
jgi:hypothetical protein